MATERRQQIIDWLRDSGNPRAEELLNSLAQMNTDEWEQKHRRDLRKIMGYADIEKNTLPLRDRARGEFDTYVDNPEWYIKGKAAKLGVNVDDLKNALAQLEEERIWNEGRERRAKEVDDRFIWNFAPESSKQRYIDDPNATIFGKEGKYNPLSKEGQDDFRDVGLGIAGTVGDFIPGFGAALGPAARTLRNEELIRNKSKSAPALTDAGKEALNDWGTYGAAAWLQNFRKAKRLATGMANDVPVMGNILKSDALNTNMLATIEGLSKVRNAKDIREINEILKNMPQNSFTSEALEKINSFDRWGDPKSVDKLITDIKSVAKTNHEQLYSAFNKEGNDWTVKRALNPETPMVNEFLEQEGVNTKNVLKNQTKHTDVAKEIYLQPKLSSFGKIIRDYALPVERKIEQGAAKNLTTMYKAGPEDKDRAKIDWYKQNYARDWEMGFVPKGKESDPMVKAYNEWLTEHGPSITNVFGD